ncbi:MAG: ABC-three component system protein [Negativicutes bacterium]
MTFSEYAQMLYPFCGDGKSPSDFVVALIGNITEDTDNEICPLLDTKPDYLRRIYNGRKSISPVNATFVMSHLDKAKFENFIISGFSVDTLQRIATVLSEIGIQTNGTDAEVAGKCTDLLEEIFTDIAAGNIRANCSFQNQITQVTKADIDEAFNELDRLLSTFPKPPEVVPPAHIEEHEQPYITELFAAYGEAECVPDFCEETLSSYTTYSDDLKDRRIDYFAAESVRRGVSEVFNGKYSDLFEILKDETLTGVKNTARRRFPNGYERLLAVMEQAVNMRVERYFLSRSPFWISNNIKMGVCHFLVSDGKLKWVNFNG